jgi:coenzyme F420 hydrogenase subunit beta
MVTHFQQFKPWRCQVCSDWVSGLADLSFADGTDDPFSLSRSGQTGVRQSFVFVWSRRGEDLLRSAVETGYLGCEESIFKANAGLELKKKRLAEATKVLNGRGNIELLANIHTRQWAL